MASPNPMPKNPASQRGSTPFCTKIPSTPTGVLPDLSTDSWYGRFSLRPNQAIRCGFSVALTKVARPGSTWTLAGCTW